MKRQRLEALIENLQTNLDKLEKSKIQLNKIFVTINFDCIKNEFGDYELERLELLSSRFARSSDFLTQKVLKNYFILVQENYKTFLDLCDICEKYGFIEKSDSLLNIRDLRNQIAHEYEDEALNALYQEIFNFTPVLMNMINIVIENINNSLKKLNSDN